MEETVDHVFQNSRVVAKPSCEAAGIALKAQRGLHGQLKRPVERFAPFRRRSENFVKRLDLTAGDNAIGLRHLGTEPNQRHGKISIANGPVAGIITAIAGQEAILALQSRREFSPKTHISPVLSVM